MKNEDPCVQEETPYTIDQEISPSQLLLLLLDDRSRRRIALKFLPNNEVFLFYRDELALYTRSSRTYSWISKKLEKFEQYLDSHAPTSDLAKTFIAQWNHCKPSTIRRIADVINSFMTWYGEPTGVIVSVPKSSSEYIENKDVQALIGKIKERRSWRATIPRDIMIVKLAYFAGLRRAEIAHLRVRDFIVEKKHLVIRNSKGSKDRVVPLPSNLQLDLIEYIQELRQDDLLIPITPGAISLIISVAAKRAGLNLHTHSLRHGYATRLLEQGASIQAIKELLGHSLLSTTQIYTSILPEQIRDAVRLLDDPDEQDGPVKSSYQKCHITKTEVITSNLSDHVPEVIRSRHWHSLIGIAENFATELRSVESMNQESPSDHISHHIRNSLIWDGTFEIESNILLFTNLLTHLDNEFSDFSDKLHELKILTNSQNDKEKLTMASCEILLNNLIEMLQIVISRGTMKGQCKICRGWYQ